MKDILDQDMCSVRAFCAVVLGVGRDKMATAIAIYKLTNGYGDRYIYCLVYVIVMLFALPAPHEESGACAG